MTFSNQELRNAIVSNNRDFMDAFRRGDSQGVAELYTSTGQLLPPNSDLIKGIQAIQGFWKAVMDMGIKAVDLETIETEGEGDTTIEVGHYRLGGNAGQVLDRGKYVVIWKQEGGKWKLHRDIWNSSMPASQ